MKILVTGGSGRLGRELQKIIKNGDFPGKEELDICLPNSIKRYLKNHRPDIIIHAAAITDIRKCEEDRKLAWNTNYIGTKNLIENLFNLKRKPYFIYISTACVFDGINAPFSESDIPNPQNFYSLTKLLGEELVSNSNQKTLVIRTNFTSDSAWPYKEAFTDRFGTYLFARDVAKGVVDLINYNKTGLVHLTGKKRMSMYDLAKIVSPNVLPMTLSDYKGPKLTIDMSLKTKNWRVYKMSPK